MSRTTLLVLDGLLYAFHTGLILFNVFGWIPRRTRRLNLACLFVTAISWFVMGIWHGIGYCVITDWHWQVRRALGIHDPEGSFVELLIRKLTGWQAPPTLVATSAAVIFLAAIVASIVVNLQPWRGEKSIAGGGATGGYSDPNVPGGGEESTLAH